MNLKTYPIWIFGKLSLPPFHQGQAWTYKVIIKYLRKLFSHLTLFDLGGHYDPLMNYRLIS